jgi:HlyD family secretion protein
MIRAAQKKLILLLSATLLLAACSKNHQIELPGYINVRYIYLAGPVSGNLQTLRVERGHSVTAGQLLAKLDQEPEFSQLAEAEKSLESEQQILTDISKGSRETILLALMAKQRQGEANLLLAKQDLDRKRILYEKKVIAKAEFDNVTAAYESTRQQVEAAKADYNEAIQGARTNKLLSQKAIVDSKQATVDRLKWLLLQKEFYAPVNAFVFDNFYEQGEFIPSGKPILALVTANQVRVTFFLPEKYLSQIQLGSPVQFNCDSCEKLTTANISYISPRAEYTPPVIYSKDTREKLVYLIEAKMPDAIALSFHSGQPITVHVNLNKAKSKHGD